MFNQNQLLTLAVETSCDETSAAVVKGGRMILSNIIASQINIHQKFGGVVPEIASRKHVENVMLVIDKAIKDANIDTSDINAVGVTYGPGLVGALLVGVAAAKAMAFALDVPLIGVNHLEGHIFANFLAHCHLEPPFISLVVSGGHTMLVWVKDYNELVLLGQTRDDAAGEAFDKIARVMGLSYPGGPQIEKIAASGNPEYVYFPRALNNDSYEFSFSGLKSAVINHLHNLKQKHETYRLEDIAASFQAAVIEVLVHKSIQAAQEFKSNKIVVAGGVAANKQLKQMLTSEAQTLGIKVFFPPPVLCTDNAAMIACRAHYLNMAGKYADLYLNAVPSLSLGK